MNEMNNPVFATGHVLIRDIDSGEILRDVHNDIHLENFSEALALSFAKYDNGVIEEIHFGNGGTIVNSTGELDYNTPQVQGINADLYNPTYSKVVNDRSPYFTDDPTKTNVRIQHTVGTTYTDIVITCTLGYGEPADAAQYDDAVVQNASQSDDPNARYIFDEMGLKTVNSNTNVRRLLTHVIFHPVQKSLNRAIEIIYTVRISMVAPN